MPFDRDSLEVTADPFLVLANAHSPSVSADGTLALVRGPGPPLRQLFWTDRRGRELETLGEPRSYERLLSLSPDGNKLAVSVLETGNRDLWVYDLERGTQTHLTSDPLPEASPAWDRDSARLVYYRGADIVIRAVNASEEPQVLAQGRFPVLSPDGRWLLYAAPGSNSAYYDIWRMPLAGGQAVKLVASEARKSWPSVSPDGRLLAYMSDETGSYEIYLTEFPSGNGKWQVSTSGGRWPRWSRDGSRITYSDSDRSLMEVEITSSPALRLGTPRKLFDRSRRIVSTFDIAPDEERFLMMRTVSDENPPVGVTLVENWKAEFPGR